MKAPETYQVQVTLQIGEQFLRDILTTAIESGYDGIGYWAGVRQIERADDLSVTALRGVFDVEEPRERFADIDVHTVLRGIGKLFDPTVKLGIARRLQAELLAELNQGAGGCGLGADDCDVLIQLGLFGRVVYGYSYDD